MALRIIISPCHACMTSRGKSVFAALLLRGMLPGCWHMDIQTLMKTVVNLRAKADVYHCNSLSRVVENHDTALKSQPRSLSPHKKTTKRLRKIPRMRNIPYMATRKNTYRHPQSRSYAHPRNPGQARRVVRSTDEYHFLPVRRQLQLLHIHVKHSGRRQVGHEPTPLFLW